MSLLSLTPSPRLLPLGALAAGFGLFNPLALAQPVAPAAGSSSVAVPAAPEATLQPIAVKARVETDASSLRAATSRIGKGEQDLRDIPQSVTVVTEKLIADRRLETLKEALHQTAGITFQAAEGGEEDIRLRGFSLAASGDIYVDGLRDPAFYERDTFNDERIELLRGSASMLFGRGSTGGVVNQVQKQAVLADVNQVDLSVGSGGARRVVGDFNLQRSETAALRIGVMRSVADNAGNRIDKSGLAVNLRLGIGQADEFSVSGYLLRNDNGIQYGLPWLRASASQANANPSGLITGLDPGNVYAAASDYNAGGAAHATLSHTHRFAGSATLKTTVRQGRYDRDQRASAIRFCQRTVSAAGVVSNPDCPTASVAADTVSAATLLLRGTNNKVQDMGTTYAQSDYSDRFSAWGLQHELLTGVDLAHEVFHGYALATPAGVTLNKNAVLTTLGTPNDGSGGVDEAARIKRLSTRFDATALGLYAQDLVQVAPDWKLLGGLRYDRFRGDFRNYASAVTAATPTLGAQTAQRGRADGLWSKRFGLLYQPSDSASFHASYGTSFNTSGDTYQYDDQSKNTPPEGSENLEIGAKIDALAGRLSTRVALFRSTKHNERNRDPDSAASAALLSGKRHTAGIELDVAGRISDGWELFGSYAWTPVARIDVGAPGSVAGVGEGAGTRSSMTPRHSGTVWSTWQIDPVLRLGAGLNARSAQTPNRNPAGIVAPGWVTADLLAELTLSDALAFKLNLLNATNRLYADALYSAHYVPGQQRKWLLTMTSRF